MRRIAKRLPVLFALAGLVLAASAPARASEQQLLVDKARIAVEELRADPNFGNFAGLLDQAKGVIIVPSLIKAGFIVGGKGGRGVLLTRNPESGDWSYPAFYTMGAASIGLQIGAQVSQAVLLVMTERGLEKLIDGNVTLGGDANVAVGPVGAGVEAGTALSPGIDFYTFARTQGAFAGASFEGAIVITSDDWNAAYYGSALSPADIVVDGKGVNPGADVLRAQLARQ